MKDFREKVKGSETAGTAVIMQTSSVKVDLLKPISKNTNKHYCKMLLNLTKYLASFPLEKHSIEH